MNKSVKWLINILAVIAVYLILSTFPYISQIIGKIPTFCIYSNSAYSPETIGGLACFLDSSWIAPILISILLVFLAQKYIKIKK